MASSSNVLLLLPGPVGSSTAATSLGLGHVLPLGQQRRYLPSSPPLCYYTSRKPWSMTGYRYQAGHRTGVSLKILLQILGNLLQPSKSISSLLPVKGMWHSPSWEQITPPCLGPQVLSPPGPAAPRCASAITREGCNCWSCHGWGSRMVWCGANNPTTHWDTRQC